MAKPSFINLEKQIKESKENNETQAVIYNYYDDGVKVLVLNDGFGNELENIGFAALPNNPILNPNGNPLTSRATTNLAINETEDGKVFGIYRGYGNPIAGKNEGKSFLFPVLFKDDDITPVKPLPDKPLFKVSGKKYGLGAEDGRIARYRDFYFIPFVAASTPGIKGTSYAGDGARFSKDLKLEKRFHLRGLPAYTKDLVPLPNKLGNIYMMHTRPSPPDCVKHRNGYKDLYTKNPGIWLAISYDLVNWVMIEEILRPLEGENKIGGGGAVYEPELEGMVDYIHGLRGEGTERRKYRGRAVLFDENNPTEAIGMTKDFLNPDRSYEKNDKYKIDHIFPMAALRRKVEINGKVYDSHLVSAGTGDISSSIYFVLVDYLKDSLIPMSKFTFSRN